MKLSINQKITLKGILARTKGFNSGQLIAKSNVNDFIYYFSMISSKSIARFLILDILKIDKKIKSKHRLQKALLDAATT